MPEKPRRFGGWLCSLRERLLGCIKNFFRRLIHKKIMDKNEEWYKSQAKQDEFLA